MERFLQSALDKSFFSLDLAKVTAKDLFWARLDRELKDRIKKYKGQGKGTIKASSGLEFYHAIMEEKSEIDAEINITSRA